MDSKDRLEKLRESTTLNGIDFVEIASPQQTVLRVHFLNTVALAGTLDTIKPAAITGGETVPTVATEPIGAADWSFDEESRPLLTLRTAAPGDFSIYTLTLYSPMLDPYFDSSRFSFKALCPSDLDCAAPDAPCPPLEGDMPPIDYLAKDFRSFRQALSDFSALRYPNWVERSEADFGMMVLEALSSLADDLSYYQDRIAAEASLDTATQRRSIVQLARLVDYEPCPATAARTDLQLEVIGGPLPSGLIISAPQPDGGLLPFETGTGLIDPTTGRLNQATYPVDPRWNRWQYQDGTIVSGPDGQPVPNIPPYWWDDSQRCLRAGSTQLWVEGTGFGFQAADPATGLPGTALLIDTPAENTADPPAREIVHLTEVTIQHDALFDRDVTRLRWGPSEALELDHDLTRTQLAGNIVPATQGRRYTESFAVDTPPAAAPGTPLALVRTGPNSTLDAIVPEYRYTLGQAPLAWLIPGKVSGGSSNPWPEIILSQQAVPPDSTATVWNWRRRLLEADLFEPAYTLDPVRFAAAARFPDGTVSYEYDGDEGDTVRFGDGTFGEIPDSGAVFDVTYRVGGGLAGNVAADTITILDPAARTAIRSATNPFPGRGGQDMETNQQVRRRAPEAFRTVQFRAVRPEDYVTQARTLPWVQNAGTVFRWTGTWLTVFATADPHGTDRLSPGERLELIELLDRRRLAGYEVYTPAPRYASLDLIIVVCAQSDAFRSDVETALLRRLNPGRLPDDTLGFFDPDQFSFGTPLERSALEAAIQRTPGVAGVASITYRERNVNAAYLDLPDELTVRADQIVRVENDPSSPEGGSLRVIVEGGK